MTAHSTLDGIADTARWVALYRALESERADALFHDPYARALAGAKGERIVAALPRSMRNASWSVVTRTVVMDRMILEQIGAGVTLVVNLAAGLDTRPYRLALPRNLTWIDVDQPALLEEKARLVASATANCTLERIPADLSQDAPTRQLLRRLGERAGKVLVITEGLIMYLRPAEVVALANAMSDVPTIQGWITDIISPGLMRMIEKDWGRTLRNAGVAMHFAPPEGVAWFDPLGWQVVECHSTFATAGRLRRLPWFMRLLSLLPGSDDFHPDRPWSGICRLQRSAPAAHP